MAPIRLIHGLFGSLSAPGILSAFGDATVLAPDLIGYGSYRNEAPTAWELSEQADHVASCLRERVDEPVDVVAHSVGGAIAVLFAGRHPKLTKSLTSIEGNLTPDDAFWSRRIATQELSEIAEEVEGFRADVSAWIGRAGVKPTPVALEIATQWLENQPVSTSRSQARAVVAATGDDTYFDGLKNLVVSGLPVHLLAGARARSGWNVPEWLARGAMTNTDIPGTGHLMMLEAPELFARSIMRNLADSTNRSDRPV